MGLIFLIFGVIDITVGRKYIAGVVKRGDFSEPWISLLPQDPREWIASSEEPAARLLVLSTFEDFSSAARRSRTDRKSLLSDPGIKSLIARLPDWEKEAVVSGHNSPSFAPNILHLLADLGLGPGDDPQVERLLDQMLCHQDSDGRFQSLGRWRNQPEAQWGSLFCDAHAIAEALLRFGRGSDPRAKRGMDRMAADLGPTSQGPGWRCRPDPVTGFRGPGRKDDFCPMVTLEALRALARLPEKERPAGCLDAARTCLRAWRERNAEKPYMFGHGRQFKIVKWPSFWYDAYRVLDTLSRYPGLWMGKTARNEDRKALAELTACLIAYNFDSAGKITPRSCYKGFESFSFGQKKKPSAVTTALLCLPLRRLSELTDEIAAIDILHLKSSKGGTGTALPPKTA